MGASFRGVPFFILDMKHKTATTVTEQIEKLKKRGMTISDQSKAEEILSDIGYYRLGFYWFPFEKGYPKKNKRNHQFVPNAQFDDAVALYYFDNDLRNILAPYLHRIEVSLRTAVIYIVSNHYRNNPTWFADKRVVNNTFIDEMPRFYTDIRKNEALKHLHRKYPNDIYAPAWKTLEYMTLGNMLYLFQNLKDDNLKEQIALRFNISNVEVFESYIKTIRIVRNICAHGHNLYDLHLPKSIMTGELKGLDAKQRSNISGCIIVMAKILDAISTNRSRDLKNRITELVADRQFASIHHLISHVRTVPKKVLTEK